MKDKLLRGLMKGTEFNYHYKIRLFYIIEEEYTDFMLYSLKWLQAV